LGYSVNAATGALTSVGPPVAAGKYPINPRVDPSGRFLYVPNVYSSTISAYAIHADTGVLSEIAGSPFATASGPRAIAIEKTGKYAYVVNSDAYQISIYSIDPSTGALAQIPDSPIEGGVEPFSLAVHPTGRFLYVVAFDIDSPFNPFCFVRAYAIDASSGALSLIPAPGGRVAAGDRPSDIVIDPSGKFIYVSNIESGNVSAYAINSTNGALFEVPGSPFAVTEFLVRAIGVDPTGKFVYLGGVTSMQHILNGWVQTYTINGATGALTPIGKPMPSGDYVSSISTMRATR
jgi:6-phosphogluconolactonase